MNDPSAAAARPSVTVREGRAIDVDAVVGMVNELAAYERAADQVRLTPEQLHRALFAARLEPPERATEPDLVMRLEELWAPLAPLHLWLVRHVQDG